MANVYGKDNIEGNIFGDIKDQITLDKDLEIAIRDSKPIRDYIYIDDIINALEILILSDTKGLYNLGSVIGASVEGLVEIFSEQAGCKIKSIKSTNIKADYSKSVLDSSKMYQDFGWKCRVNMSEGIKKILKD